MSLKHASILCLLSCALSGGYTTDAYAAHINEIRIDYVQHGMSALIGFLKL